MMRKKAKTRSKKTRKSSGRQKVKLPDMPKPLKERVLKEKPEKPSDVQVVTEGSDPVVWVRGKVVGAWIDL
jgi:hypothetical protein